MMDLIIAITNGFRAWGASSLLLALPVLGPAVVSAIRGALMAAHAEAMLSLHLHWSRVARVFVIALWREGETQLGAVNLWVIVCMMLFVGGAGGSIFVADNFGGGYYDPRLVAIMFVAWFSISLGGWIFTISSARDVVSMAICSFLLLSSFTVLSLGEKGFL